MFKKLFIIILLLGLLTGTTYAGQPEWSVHMKVSVPDERGSDGTIWNHLIAGIRTRATDGFDSGWDTLSMIETDDPVQAMFTHGTAPEDNNNDGMIDRWACVNPDQGYTEDECALWGDLRTFDAEKVWSFVVLSPANGITVTLQWAFDGSHDSMDIELVDLSNPAVIVDMKGISKYSYTNNFDAGRKYGIRYFEIRMKFAGLFITPAVLHDATTGVLYTENLSAIGGNPVWSIVSGALPPEIILNPYTGEIVGTPETAGSYNFTIKGDDPVTGYSNSMEYSIDINSLPDINVSGIPDGIAGDNYYGKMAITGGSAPFRWKIWGNLPEGLIFNSDTAEISGRAIIPGIYEFTVMLIDANNAVAADDCKITVSEPEDHSPPEGIKNLSGMYINNTSVLLSWTAPPDNSITGTGARYDLRYLENCPGVATLDEGTWANAYEAFAEPRPQSGTLHVYTLTGLSSEKNYCIAIRSMDASGNISVLSNIITFPLLSDSSGLAASGLIELISTFVLRKGYNFISLPLIPYLNDRESLFGIIVGNPVGLYRWYSAYPGITPPQYYMEDVVQPGMGYLLYSPFGNADLVIDGLKIWEKEHIVSLQNGWNMIGPPYDEPVLLADILVRGKTTGEVKSYADAVKAGWVGNSVYQLTDGSYEFISFNDEPPAMLQPWAGYWMFVGESDGVEIIFSKAD